MRKLHSDLELSYSSLYKCNIYKSIVSVIQYRFRESAITLSTMLTWLTVSGMGAPLLIVISPWLLFSTTNGFCIGMSFM